MKRSRVMAFGILVCVLAAAGTGCTDNLKAERDQLFRENEELRAELLDTRAALDACEGDRSSLANDLAMMRDDYSQMQNQLENQRTTGFENIPGVTGEIGMGEVTARVEGDVLFSSGKIELKSSAKQSLDRVASVLNSNYSGKTIRIEGHTDSDPIRKSPWKTNDRLSAERAMAVKQYLESRGVSSDRMYIAGFGPSRPMGSKAQSRRVEIVVVMAEE